MTGPLIGAQAARRRASFFARVLRSTDADCWLWTGEKTRDGYGRIWASDPTLRMRAHRYAYELLVEPIPHGHELHHICGVKNCVNPTHLQAVTPEEHSRIHYGISECKHGHPYDEGNTYLRLSGGRDCRACMRDRKERWKQRQAA